MKSKALLLLTTFLLHTLVGLGCALRSSNHENPKHQISLHGATHQEHRQNSSGKKGCQGHCCKDSVGKFNGLAKLVPSAQKQVKQTPIFLTANDELKREILHPATARDSISYSIIRERPPNQKIRILLQSFLI